MYGRPLDTLLVTFGVSLILQQAAKDIFGAPNVERAGAHRGCAATGPCSASRCPTRRLFIMALVAVVVVGGVRSS